MTEAEVARYWNNNAPAWTQLVRMGCDVLRDFVNTPAFMAMLPEVRGLRGLDIGCGEGNNTRILAQTGAQITAIDIADIFLNAAREHEQGAQLGIDYLHASAADLPFADASFDFATAFMSLMDMPRHEQVLAECRRVLRPGGFLQFSITHPCFATPRWKWVHDDAGKRVAMVCGEYFRELNGEEECWMFKNAPQELRESLPQFRIPRFTRTLSSWLNLLIQIGFTLEEFAEPTADKEALLKCPQVYDTQVIAYVLTIRCRKK